MTVSNWRERCPKQWFTRGFQSSWQSSLQMLLHSLSKLTLWRLLHLCVWWKINHKSYIDFNDTFRFLIGTLTVSKIVLCSVLIEFSSQFQFSFLSNLIVKYLHTSAQLSGGGLQWELESKDSPPIANMLSPNSLTMSSLHLHNSLL